VLFNSFTFIYFFLLIYGLYLCLKRPGQNILLLIGSYVFYGTWNWRFLSLLLISTIVDYCCGLFIYSAQTRRVKKRFLVFSVVSNLSILFVFKYYDFFILDFQRLLELFGFEPHFYILSVILPVGISFYTFQTMSYTIDIYREEMCPTRNFLNFALFVSFFPQLIAGPIERARRLLPQLENCRVITYGMIREGCWLILFGYYKKVVLADNMAPFVDQVFNHPDTACGLSIIVALLAFSMQIYGDFSGYSDIARGISKLFGVNLMLNFRMPYFAINPRDFWRRWHISLSTWLRDYVYIPLGGNRLGSYRTSMNLMTTMLLGGLWHGAAWHFVAWGLYHGVLLAFFRFVTPRKLFPNLHPWPPRRLIKIILFFPLTLIAWLLFRVNYLGDVPVLLGNIFSPFVLNGKVGLLTIFLFATPMLVIEIMQEVKSDMLVIKRWVAPVRWACYSLLFLFIILFGSVTKNEFIYFQF